MNVKYVYCLDWRGLYIDDELKVEGKTLNAHDILNALNIKYTEHEACEEWFEDLQKRSYGGTLPANFKDIKLAPKVSKKEQLELIKKHPELILNLLNQLQDETKTISSEDIKIARFLESLGYEVCNWREKTNA